MLLPQPIIYAIDSTIFNKNHTAQLPMLTLEAASITNLAWWNLLFRRFSTKKIFVTFD